jgi:pimeloyl-ACP methyl ester carboxylesterase
MRPSLRYTTTKDGYDIAYSVKGEGVPLVLMPCILQGDIAEQENIPAFRSQLDPLAERYKLILYDARGTGSSTRGISAEHAMLDTLVDLEAVVDALGLSRLILHADIFACYTAMRFAAKYPERVSALILVNPAPLYGEPLMPSWRDMYVNAWPIFIETFISTGTPGGDDMRRLLANAVRQEDFIRIADGAIGHCIADAMTDVAAPTLVMASRPFLNPLYMKVASDVASGLSDARLVWFDGTKNADFMMSSDGQVPPGVQTLFQFLEDLGLDGSAAPGVAPDSAAPAGESEAEATPRVELTKRQQEILALIAGGRTTSEMAAKLFLSNRTVERHIGDLYDRLGVRNRAEATAVALNQDRRS